MKESLKKAISQLKKGGVIIHPTDTIPGLAADATNPAAVERIYHIKARDSQKPLLILCADLEMVHQYVSYLPAHALKLLDTYGHLPITLIYPQAKNLPKNLVANEGSIGIRIPQHTASLSLIRGLGKPIASTSANLSGQPAPQQIGNIDAAVLKLVDYVLNLPATEQPSRALSSWIVKVETSGFSIIRTGKAHLGLSQWLEQQFN